MLRRTLACAGIVAFSAIATAQDAGERTTVTFSDPSRPGLLHLGLVTGSITVRGRNVKDVIIEARARDGGNQTADRASGMRRLGQQPSISVEERNNRMQIVTAHPERPVDFEIQVPLRTNLDLSTVNRGDILVEGVEGELETGNVNGAITLTDVSGSVVAHTVNGRVLVTLVRVTPQKPMAFTSLNGAVEVDLPADLKANLKLRTDNGKVFTDFDVNLLQSAASVVEDTRRSGGRYRIEVNKVIYGAVNGGGPDIEMRTFNGNIFVRKGK